MPLLDLQADPYAGGSLVFSALAMPVVAIGGPSIFALKLVALLWSAAGLAAWTALVDRYWGRRAAHLFAFLFVFGPPLFVVYNLIAMGSHAEVVTLSGVQLLVGYRYLYGGARSTRALVAWSAVAGIATWFTYVSIVPFAVCVAIGLIGGALPPRRWPALAAGFAAGLTPWIATNFLSGGRGLDVVVRTFHSGSTAPGRSIGGYFEYLGYLVRTGIPLGLRFPDVLAPLTGDAARRLLLAHVYLAGYVLSWGVLLIGCMVAAGRRTRGVVSTLRELARACVELPLLIIFPLFVLLVAATDQVFLENELAPFLPFRLMVPFIPPVMVVLAVAVAHLGARWRRPAVLALALIGCAGTLSVLAAGSSERPRIAAHARELGAEAMGHLLYYKHGSSMPVLNQRVAAMPEELRPAAYEGIGFSVAYHYPAGAAVADIATTLTEVPPRYRGDAVFGARLALGPGMEQVPPVPPSERGRALLEAVSKVE
ncbi:MAG: hypothetical protein E6J72_04785 [Deltaproteobacteria bacterium]|nr:MAG: hypothetical protein E6J72_04785 [Deltaproteobacteria bacterium]